MFFLDFFSILSQIYLFYMGNILLILGYMAKQAEHLFLLACTFCEFDLLFSLSSLSIIIMMLKDKDVIKEKKIMFLALSKKSNLDY